MTILNRYKARILKQLNITHEAWWDDWYDKTFDDEYFDKGPVDVWEEPALPKELGVKSPVWTELLTRGDDDMFPYRNVGGNSGVAEYDSGVDWFLIKFKDGSLYLYTHKSTLPEHIYRMRQLAESGSGLNAYVNHMYNRHGVQYAGRNYKGNLTLTPGIESIGNHKGIRALQLIIAFQNTLRENNMQDTISQESIGALFTRLKNFVQGRDEHGIKGNENKPGAKIKSGTKWWSDSYKKEIEQVRDAVKRFYLNPNWLDKQTIVTGTVDPKGIAEPLNFNGVLGSDPLGNIPKGMAYVATVEKKWMSVLMDYDNKIQTIDKRVKQQTVGSKVTDDRGEELVKKAIAEMRAIPAPEYKSDGTCGLGNIGLTLKDDSVVAEVVKKFDVPKTLPALTKEQIISAAQLILKILDFDNIYSRVKTPSWLDHSDGHKFNDWLNNNYESTYFEYYDLDHHSLNDLYVDGLYDLFDEPGTLNALENWIDRSLKSNATKSSNERYNMTNVISQEKFDELKEKSGKDGLEPTAQKALKIAESLLGKHQASNEGIWGAVRYLFGGNYADLPKINAAYDEAVDAVKSTYGNPEWVKKRRLNTGKVKVKGFSKVAENPQAMFDAVKKNNQKSFEEAQAYVKEEVEYLSKYIAALNAPADKVKALLDMFEVRPPVDLQQAPEVDLGSPGDVGAKDASGIISTAAVFNEAVKYRRATDAIYTGGLYKLAYTDSGKARYGRDGIETSRLEGDAKELSIKIGQVLHNVQQSFYNSFTPAWDNIDGVVRGSLFIMEASAD